MRELIGSISYPRVGNELALEYSRVYTENGKNVLVFRLINHSNKTVTDYTVDVDFYADGRPQLQTVRRSGLFIAPEGTSEEHELIISAEADEGELRIATVLYSDLTFHYTDVAVPFATSEAISRMANQILDNPAQYAPKIREYEETVARLAASDAAPRESKTAFVNRSESAEDVRDGEDHNAPTLEEEANARPAPKRRGVKRFVFSAIPLLLIVAISLVGIFTDTSFNSSDLLVYAEKEYVDLCATSDAVLYQSDSKIYANANSVLGSLDNKALLIVIPQGDHYRFAAAYGSATPIEIRNSLNNAFEMNAGTTQNDFTVQFSTTASNYDRYYHAAGAYTGISAGLIHYIIQITEQYSNSSSEETSDGYHIITNENGVTTIIKPNQNVITDDKLVLIQGIGDAYQMTVPLKEYDPFVNRTSTYVNEDLLTRTISAFSKATGTTLVVLMDTPQNVFGNTVNDEEQISLIILGAMVLLALFLIIKAILNHNYNRKGKKGTIPSKIEYSKKPLVMAILAVAMVVLNRFLYSILNVFSMEMELTIALANYVGMALSTASVLLAFFSMMHRSKLQKGKGLTVVLCYALLVWRLLELYDFVSVMQFYNTAALVTTNVIPLAVSLIFLIVGIKRKDKLLAIYSAIQPLAFAFLLFYYNIL